MVLVGVVPSWTEERKYFINQDYMESVLRAGGMPVVFPITADRNLISEMLDRVDGVMLTGGVDVDPAYYGETKKACCGECSACRDAMEFPLCREALRRRMPLLAICRGMQLLSCALGGTLYQDLEEEFGKEIRHPRHDVPADPVHDVEVLPDTLLASVTGTGPLGVNSRHHQGIRKPGAGLAVSATAPDGLAEGVELPGYPFVLGVQWHPESLSARYPAHQKLFDAFVEACTAFARQAGGKPAAGE